MPARHANTWIQLATMFGVFTGGGFIGLWLASWAAPGSGVAAGLSVLLLPGAFAAGLLVWAGLDTVLDLIDLARRGGRRRTASTLSPLSGRWFLPLSLVLTAPAGLVVGLLPGGQGVVASLVVYGTAGAAYGLVVGRLAARGYLPGPHLD